MPGLMQRFRSWMGKDETARAEEQATSNQADREAAVEDYESLKDDRSIPGSYIAGGLGDYERDSKPPSY